VSIQFTNQKTFSTPSNTVIGCNQSKMSVSFFLRADALLGNGNFSNVIFRNTFSFTVAGTGTPGVVKLTARIGTATQAVSANMMVPQGSTNHIALTYDQGVQTLWLNGVAIAMGAISGNTYSHNEPLIIGVNPTGTVTSTLYDVAIWNNYVLLAAEIRDLRDAIKRPDDIIAAGSTWKGWWTLSGSGTPTLGDAGLANNFGDTPTNLTATMGTGSDVYTSTLVWTPSARIKDAYVPTGGKNLVVLFEAISGGAEALPTAVNITPTVSRNGVSVGSLGTVWLTGFHKCLMYPLPSGIQIRPGDVVSLDASTGWANTTLGLTEAYSGTIDNRTGRSSFGTESLPRTLKIGMNHPHLGTNSICHYQVSKNWLKRTGTFRNTLDSSFKPISGTSGSAVEMTRFGGNNGIDSTTYPGPTGKFAIGWDDPLPSDPTTFRQILDGINDWSTLTELVPNPGNLDGTGKVRVFNIGRSNNPTNFYSVVDFVWEQAHGTPRFNNLVIHGPGDFEYRSDGTTVLDRSDPYALCSRYRDRMSSGLGSCRWVDSTIDYNGSSAISEPTGLHNIDDFTWGDGTYKLQRTIPYTSSGPVLTDGSMYIYSRHFGTPFSATLGSDIDATTTTLNITDAATAPVIIGLQLRLNSEMMEVVGVSGTSVTVTRGLLGTTAVPHLAGVYPTMVQNRFQITDLRQFMPGSPTNFCVQITSQNPHGLRTGNKITFEGSGWPLWTYTDGSSATVTPGGEGMAWVTGANTYVMAYQSGAPATPYPAKLTLAGTYALNPAVHHGSVFPRTQFPYEFVARTTGSIVGADLHINIPYAASDSLVWEIARRVRDNFPAGRTVWLELANEPWLMANAKSFFNLISRLYFPTGNFEEFYVQRSDQIRAIFRTVFGSRSGEIKSLLNAAQGDLSNYRALIATCESLSIQLDAIAIACYIDGDSGRGTTTPSSLTAYSTWDTEQVIDLWIHDFAYDTTGFYAGRQAVMSSLAAHNTLTGDQAVMYAYEGGVSTVYPSAVANHFAKTADAIYHPNWYWIELDLYGLWQTVGYHRFNIYGLAMFQVSGNLWGVYRWMDQDHGYGDGSDGKADNRLCLATTKLPTVNQDLQNVSVRGQALLDWNRSVHKKRRRVA
jgi:Concanavalin A-like lectin/glucanases superfamily